MFWSLLYIFRVLSTRESASVAFDDGQRHLIQFRGPTQETVLVPGKKWGENSVTLKLNGPEKVEIRRREIPGSRLSMCGYIPTYSGLKERTFDNSEFSVEMTLVFASAELCCG